MSLARYEEPTAAALPALTADAHYMAMIPRLADQLARSGMCPQQFRGKPDDIAIVGYALADTGMRLTISTLPQCYVVHGRPDYMAQLQIAMAARCGVPIVPLDEQSDDRKASVKIRCKDGAWREVTCTWEEAERAGWVAKNPNYKTIPGRMLMARAVTKAIDRHAPEVTLGLAGTAGYAEVVDVDSRDTDPETGELAGEGERRAFYETLRRADTAARARAIEQLRIEGIPAAKDPQLTSAQAQRALDVIWDAVDADVPPAPEPPTEPEPGPVETPEQPAPTPVEATARPADPEPKPVGSKEGQKVHAAAARKPDETDGETRAVHDEDLRTLVFAETNGRTTSTAAMYPAEVGALYARIRAWRAGITPTGWGEVVTARLGFDAREAFGGEDGE